MKCNCQEWFSSAHTCILSNNPVDNNWNCSRCFQLKKCLFYRINLTTNDNSQLFETHSFIIIIINHVIQWCHLCQYQFGAALATPFMQCVSYEGNLILLAFPTHTHTHTWTHKSFFVCIIQLIKFVGIYVGLWKEGI